MEYLRSEEALEVAENYLKGGKIEGLVDVNEALQQLVDKARKNVEDEGVSLQQKSQDAKGWQERSPEATLPVEGL